MVADTQVDKKELWRDVELIRNFAGDDTEGLYDEILRTASWKCQLSETKDFRTGSYFLRYDRDGKMKMGGMQTAGYKWGSVPRLDALLERLLKKFGLTGDPPGIGMYWFSDGDAGVGSHRHSKWSARLLVAVSVIFDFIVTFLLLFVVVLFMLFLF
ncbi:unnamed protein product [Polarella glacialis]|uniref:Uncharacterized protein n=1 Tax=Polarella glacialis TaxID=89957 RepID=A0A813G431_POLGL|nr:unnamed protein product [Polarella glacialis]